MKKVAGSIKGELAQYREMAAFSQFGSDLDASTQKLLARGERLTELLKQGQFSPLASEEQVILLYAGVNGYMDTIEVNQINHFEEQFMESIKKDYANILDDIRFTNALSDDNPLDEIKMRWPNVPILTTIPLEGDGIDLVSIDDISFSAKDWFYQSFLSLFVLSQLFSCLFFSYFFLLYFILCWDNSAILDWQVLLKIIAQSSNL